MIVSNVLFNFIDKINLNCCCKIYIDFRNKLIVRCSFSPVIKKITNFYTPSMLYFAFGV